MHTETEDDGEADVAETLRRDVARKRRARRRGDRGLWFGLGAFGLVGWSVAIPTLAGLALGVWLDGRLGGAFSWTLALLVAGVCAGCANAWYWIAQESRRTAEAEGDGDDV
jgi:ATP synthase protein I